MADFMVNGKLVSPSKNQKLLRFLRDELHLTSVKDGCSQGACGACTVIIDGETCKACVPDTDTLAGRTIITVEGLSEWEKEVYTFAYAEAGAVQCGFCIPGMVLCTKALLDKNPDPDETQIRYALRNNYCRCTGYVKIIAAVKLAAQIMRDGVLPEAGAKDWRLGSRVQRIDAREKVLGTGKYPDDYYMEGMLLGGLVRSKYARARVLSIDTSKAAALCGVAAVYTAKDVPGENMIGHLRHDQYVFVPEGELTHYMGDAIALVVAGNEDVLEKAKKLVRVEYEELPAIHNPGEAAADSAPVVFEGAENNICSHEHISRGNAAEAIAGAKHVISEHFETPWTEHAFLEPECATAFIDEEGDVFVYSTDQSAHQTLHECVMVLGTDRVKVQNALVGGGFGGKEDMTVQPFAALAAFLLKRPVKVKLSREESLLVHPKRHPFSMDVTMGCDERGIIKGVKAVVISDTGGYMSLGGPVLQRACTHAAGPYAYENFEIDGTAYYTNNPPAGAFRGFGVTQTCFATETLLNMMADEVGISPWEIRYRNAIRPGGVLPNGQIVDESTGLAETLEAVKEDYDKAWKAGIPVGIACAMKNAGVGVGIPDTGRVKLIVGDDEKLHIFSGASCIGQGLGTVLVQMIVENTDLGEDDIVYERSNTWISPDSGTTSGSRQTLVTGEACRRACEELMEDRKKGMKLKDMKGKVYYGEYLAKTDPLGADVPNPVSHVAYGYATQMCILDPKSGKIEEIVAAHDVGKAVNPLSCEGQIEGGVVMSMGYALREKYEIDENCAPVKKYGALGLFRSHEVPKVKAIVVEKPGLNVACGSIGIGEITSIPTAPAIADAYYRYDGARRFVLPIKNTPYEREGQMRSRMISNNLASGAERRTPLPHKTAVVACSGCRTKTGEGSCSWGCIGCGACEQACPFGAITWNERGAAEIREELCRGCGLCAKACPKNLIHLHTSADYVVVKCSNRDAGVTARQACDQSCIGCGICQRTCTAEAIHVTENCAVIDETYCLSCGMCVVKCPRGVLHDRRGVVVRKA